MCSSLAEDTSEVDANTQAACTCELLVNMCQLTAENQMCPNPSSRDIRYIWHVAHAVLVVSGVHVSVSHKASIVAVADWCVLSF